MMMGELAINRECIFMFQCRSQRCHKVLLDLACTQCGELVILHKSTIAGSSSRNQHKADDDDIDAVKLADLQDIDIAKQHTMQ